MIKRWHYCIMGFTQDEGEPTGIEDLWMEMRGLASPDANIKLMQWNADWKLEAKFIARCSDPNPLISIYAYSWGCGNGFVELAKALNCLDTPLAVRTAVLCDPIVHIPLAPLLALDPNAKLNVPENVGELWWFYQRNDPHLRGQQPVGEDTTIIHPGVEVPGAIHATIDEAPEFHQKAKEVAQWIESQQQPPA